MAGHVRERDNGYQAVVVVGYGRGADRRYGEVRRRKGDAKNDLALMEAALLGGTFIDPRVGKISLVERMRQDTARRLASGEISHNTAISYDNTLGHVKRFFGTRSMAGIARSDVQAFVSQLDLAPSTVETVFGNLRATIRLAIADGIISRDPTLKINLPKVAVSTMVIPTDREVERLHACAPDGFAAAIVLSAGCGMRAQEAAGLVVADVDFLRRAIRVHHQWHGRLARFEELKTDNSVREIPVGDDILATLAAHIGAHGTGRHDLIVHATGMPLNASLFQSRWRRTRKLAGLDDLRFHSLRHHYASTAISAGVPLPALSRALGHSKSSVTLDVYGHLMVDDSDRLRSATTARFGARNTAAG